MRVRHFCISTCTIPYAKISIDTHTHMRETMNRISQPILITKTQVLIIFQTDTLSKRNEQLFPKTGVHSAAPIKNSSNIYLYPTQTVYVGLYCFRVVRPSVYSSVIPSVRNVHGFRSITKSIYDPISLKYM